MNVPSALAHLEDALEDAQLLAGYLKGLNTEGAALGLVIRIEQAIDALKGDPMQLSNEDLKALGKQIEGITKKALEKSTDEIPDEIKAAVLFAGKTAGEIIGKQILGVKLEDGDQAMLSTAMSTIKRTDSLCLLIGKEIAVSIGGELAATLGPLAAKFGKAFIGGLGIPLPI